MSTLRFSIKEVQREHPIAVVSPDDFVTEPLGEIDPQRVLEDPAFSLYCFDPAHDEALFVAVDDPALVDSAAFYYQAQAEHATAGASMDMETFHRLAEHIHQPPNGVTLIHSVGRCGSTLMSKLLQAVPDIYSLSEPDDLTQLTALRGTEDMDDRWIARALGSSVRWRCKPRVGRCAELVAIKTRAEVLALADLMGSCFADAKHLFLYRDGLSWMRTIFRVWPLDADVHDDEQNRVMQERWGILLPELRSMRPMNAVEIRTMGWIVAMEGYLALRETGVAIRAVRYEDLVSCPLSVVRQVFEFLGIDDVSWPAIDDVLGRDSQAGTVFDREERRKLTNELTPELEQDVRNLVASRPSLSTPDVLLHGTISCS